MPNFVAVNHAHGAFITFLVQIITLRQFYNILSSAVLSGICISISSICYLRVGGIAGAVLFSFGLLAVVHYGWKLYTGVSGFVRTRRDLVQLPLILVGNILGCVLTALVMRYSQPALVDSAHTVFNSRLGLGLVPCALMGVGCGFIMTTVVKFAREGKFLPLLFGVPIFILCGFLHSIADAFYISMLPADMLAAQCGEILAVYILVVVGNFVGCNLTRIITLTRTT